MTAVTAPVTVFVVSPWGSGGGRLPYAFAQQQPPVEMTAEFGYRLRTEPDAPRLLLHAHPDAGPEHAQQMTMVIHEAGRPAEDGRVYNAEQVSWPSAKVLQRVAALQPGDTATAGSPRPYRLTEEELRAYAGRTFFLHPWDRDAAW